jgi:hypothetical protein
MIAAAGAGLCWLLLMLQLGRVQNWSWKYTSLVPFALILGGLSAYATVFEISIEQRFFVFERYSPHWLLNLIYAVLGIGLREETLKLLFSLPVILLARKAEPIVVLTLASCTGLGFAIEENTQYYAGDWGAVFARFLTANFAHMMWTGMAGLAFTDALKGRTSWGEFFEQLAFVIAMHGLYDFFIIDSTIADLAFFSSHIYAGSNRRHLFYHDRSGTGPGQSTQRNRVRYGRQLLRIYCLFPGVCTKPWPCLKSSPASFRRRFCTKIHRTKSTSNSRTHGSKKPTGAKVFPSRKWRRDFANPQQW